MIKNRAYFCPKCGIQHHMPLCYWLRLVESKKISRWVPDHVLSYWPEKSVIANATHGFYQSTAVRTWIRISITHHQSLMELNNRLVIVSSCCFPTAVIMLQKLCHLVLYFFADFVTLHFSGVLVFGGNYHICFHQLKWEPKLPFW